MLSEDTLVKAMEESVPGTWTTKQYLLQNEPRSVYSYSTEFQRIRNFLPSTPSMVLRNEDTLRYGMFLIRQQHLIYLDGRKYKTVRKFVKIPRHKVQDAIKFRSDLDERKTGFKAVYQKHLGPVDKGEVVFVVSTIVAENGDDPPEHQANMFIEYIVTF